jgi:mitochondrial import receptor subunit TOM70
MSTEQVPIPPVQNISGGASSLSSSTSSSLWDRLSNWVADNKAVVYTVGAVAIVVTGAGVVYYLSGSNRGLDNGSPSEEKRKSKKDRRKARKQQAEELKNDSVLKPDVETGERKFHPSD